MAYSEVFQDGKRVILKPPAHTQSSGHSVPQVSSEGDVNRLARAVSRRLEATGRLPLGQDHSASGAPIQASTALDQTPVTLALLNNPNRLKAAIERRLKASGRKPVESRR